MPIANELGLQPFRHFQVFPTDKLVRSSNLTKLAKQNQIPKPHQRVELTITQIDIGQTNFYYVAHNITDDPGFFKQIRYNFIRS